MGWGGRDGGGLSVQFLHYIHRQIFQTLFDTVCEKMRLFVAWEYSTDKLRRDRITLATRRYLQTADVLQLCLTT